MFLSVFLIITVLSLFQPVSWGADKAPVFPQKYFAHLAQQQVSWCSGRPKSLLIAFIRMFGIN